MFYIGPETLMPLASALAAIVGVVMLFWRKTVQLSKWAYRGVSDLLSRLFSTS